MEAGESDLEEWKGLFDENIALVLSRGEQAYRITAAAAGAGVQLQVTSTADDLDASQLEAEGSPAPLCSLFGVGSIEQLVGRVFVSKEHRASAAATELFLTAAAGGRRTPPSLEEFTNDVAASFASLSPPDLDRVTTGELLDLCTAVFETGGPDAWAQYLQGLVAARSAGAVEVVPAARDLLPQPPPAADREVMLQVRRRGEDGPAMVLHLMPHSLAGWTVYAFE